MVRMLHTKGVMWGLNRSARGDRDYLLSHSLEILVCVTFTAKIQVLFSRLLYKLYKYRGYMISHLMYTFNKQDGISNVRNITLYIIISFDMKQCI